MAPKTKVILNLMPQAHFYSLSSHLAIDVDAADIKALYRRCQALEMLGKLDMAFKDVQRCATLEPKNKTFLETLRRLGADIQAKVSIKQNKTPTHSAQTTQIPLHKCIQQH